MYSCSGDLERNNRILVSVIIPTYNSAKYIKNAINSALEQTTPPCEIVVIDDGSVDNTDYVVKSYVESKKIIYIKKQNGGAASARNLGLLVTRGDLIAFLDADDIWVREKLEKQIKLFKNKNVGLVYSGRFFLASERSLDSTPLFSGKVTGLLIKNNFITNSSVVVCKDIISLAGVFREEDRFKAIEDYDLWLRISLLCDIAYVNDALVGYRIHDEQISNINYAAIVKNVIKFYFYMFLDVNYRNFRFLIFVKILQNLKEYIMSLIKFNTPYVKR